MKKLTKITAIFLVVAAFLLIAFVILTGRSLRIQECQETDVFSYSSDKLDISLHDSKLKIVIKGEENEIYEYSCGFVSGTVIGQTGSTLSENSRDIEFDLLMFFSSSMRISFTVPEDHPLFELDGKSFWLDREEKQ
ncbi:MAG: hypothetical protein IJS45_08205 [Clostridia bacterium]|nr:hypothetical protein [Clostridia bacterium]